VRGNVSVDNDVLLVTDFVNLKIKSAQSFRNVHRGRIYVYVFIYVSAHTCISIYVCNVFLKKELVIVETVVAMFRTLYSCTIILNYKSPRGWVRIAFLLFRFFGGYFTFIF
jgi:hypothetical protein